MRTLCKCALAMFLAAGLIVGVPSPVSAGGLVSTAQAIQLENGSDAWTVVDSWLARDEIASQLAALGVDRELARLRVAAMTNDEIVELAQNIHQAPAGGDGVIAVLGVTFLVLLILELVGVIDIFKRT